MPCANSIFHFFFRFKFSFVIRHSIPMSENNKSTTHRQIKLVHTYNLNKIQKPISMRFAKCVHGSFEILFLFIFFFFCIHALFILVRFIFVFFYCSLLSTDLLNLSIRPHQLYAFGFQFARHRFDGNT